MIFYFTGTGNSLDAANRIGERLKDEKRISMASYTKASAKTPIPYMFRLEKNERVGFVFPIHAWGPPQPVLDFIDRLVLENYQSNYIYCVATCGKNIGNTMRLIRRHLMKRGYWLDSGFSLVMPNNYILAGDVDSKEIQKTILIEAGISLNSFLQRIEIREREVYFVEKGPLPFLLTGLVHPAFSNQPFKTKPFFATDECNQCGICVRVCNCGNIELKGKPVWGSDCTQCLACIHACPTRAIQYGKSTQDKGRYINPNVTIGQL